MESSFQTLRGATLSVAAIRFVLFFLPAIHLSTLATPFPVVPSFERRQSHQPIDARAVGELLLGELGCVNCHASPPQVTERITPYRGPKLDLANTRLRADYLQRLIEHPQKAQPGTRMPHLLAHFAPAEKERVGRAITAFLGTFALRRHEQENLPFDGSFERGRKLFHSMGCVACHEPEKGYRPTTMPEDEPWQAPLTRSAPLANLQEKYVRGGLAQFIRDPLSVRPSGRMPDFRLTAQEADDLEAYLLPKEMASASSAPEDHGLAELGRQFFNELRCAACHEFTTASVQPIRHRPAKALVDLQIDASSSCFGDQPSKEIPLYSLNEAQKSALRVALWQINEPFPLTPGAQVARRLEALNCYACHEGEGAGGPEVARRIYFESSAEDVGDEGRLPPTLTGVGGKLLPEAIHSILLGQASVRPYMMTRMPSFGSDHAGFLASRFVEADLDPKVKPTLRITDPVNVGRNSWGRELMGDKGLTCIACHALKRRRALGVQAVDLAHSPKRLRPEWFRDYLLDPAKFRPGTRMPSFWPDGKGIIPGAEGSAERQIDSIWVYLNEIDQSRLPSGMEDRGDFELIPKDRPIVFRTFMKVAGLHAIAVGFPQRLHAAFDAKQVRWALAWKGKFLDAEGTWDDRFTPLTAPLGEAVLLLPEGPTIAWLKTLDEPWPNVTGRAGSYTFLGYRLDQSGNPTFLYRFDDVEIADSLRPLSGGGQGFRRTVHLEHASRQPRELWFRAAAAQRTIEPDDDSFRIDKQWTLVAPQQKTVIRVCRGQPELLIFLQFQNGRATIVEEIRW